MHYKVWLIAVPFFAMLLGYISCAHPLSILLVFGVLFIWMIAGAVITLAIAFSKDSNTVPKWREPLVNFLWPFSTAIVLGVFLGHHVHNWQSKRVREFVAGVVPKLDEYYRQHRSFPSDLSTIGIAVLPSVSGRQIGYFGEGPDFIFDYPARWELIDRMVYSSERRTWRHD